MKIWFLEATYNFPNTLSKAVTDASLVLEDSPSVFLILSHLNIWYALLSING